MENNNIGNMNLNEIFDGIDQINDLRKKETLELIERTKNILRSIWLNCQKNNLSIGFFLKYGKDLYNDNDYKIGREYYKLSINDQGVYYEIYKELDHLNSRENYFRIIDKDKTLLQENSDHIKIFDPQRENPKHVLYGFSDEKIIKQINEREETITRSAWISIAKKIPDLINKIKEIADQRENETKNALDLVNSINI